jgi:hypothetical protein
VVFELLVHALHGNLRWLHPNTFAHEQPQSFKSLTVEHGIPQIGPPKWEV